MRRKTGMKQRDSGRWRLVAGDPLKVRRDGTRCYVHSGLHDLAVNGTEGLFS